MQNDIELKPQCIECCTCESSISICEIKGKVDFICINCRKLSCDRSTITSDDSKKTINSSPSIQILTIGQPFENKLEYFIKKNNIRCISSSMTFIFLFIIIALIFIIINK